MRKLIACDVDGTLIPEGEQWISPAVLQEAKRLTDEGWLFAFCSGRQLANLEAIAKDLAGRVYYITQNGAAVYASGKQPQPMYITAMHRPGDGGLTFFFGYQLDSATPEEIEFLYYFTGRVLFRSIENPDKTVKEIIDMT